MTPSELLVNYLRKYYANKFSFVQSPKYTLSEIIEAIDREMNRVGWIKEKGRQYLMDSYGKRSRLHLNDEELMEFWGYLKDLERKGDGRVDS